MRSELDQLSEDAQDEYSEQISQVRSRATELREGIQTTAETPSAAALADVRGDLSALGTAVQELGLGRGRQLLTFVPVESSAGDEAAVRA